MSDHIVDTTQPNGHIAVSIDVTAENFMHDVVEASQTQLVLLDLWAPWCEPCKQLTPMLETLVRDSGGTVRLAKMNIDEHPQIAQQMQVQSIPAVFAFKGGRPVDGFMGMISQIQLKQFIEKHLDDALPPSAHEQLLAEAQAAMNMGALVEATNQFAAILQNEPTHIGAIVGLAQCHIASGNLEQAAQVLQFAPANTNEPDLDAARAQLALAQKSIHTPDIAPLEARVEANPDDFQAQFELALAYNANGAQEQAVNALLTIIAQQPNWNDDAARKQLLEFFAAYGIDNPVTINGRRRLSSALFR